jgi:hypothetical protein
MYYMKKSIIIVSVIREIRRTPGGPREDNFGLYFETIKNCKIIFIVVIPFTAEQNVIG